jgi:small subunit ribosomal protein S6
MDPARVVQTGQRVEELVQEHRDVVDRKASVAGEQLLDAATAHDRAHDEPVGDQLGGSEQVRVVEATEIGGCAGCSLDRDEASGASVPGAMDRPVPAGADDVDEAETTGDEGHPGEDRAGVPGAFPPIGSAVESAASLSRLSPARPEASPAADSTSYAGQRKALLPRRVRGRSSPEEVETAVRAYEVMVILDPSLEERTVEPSLDKYLNVIRKDGGSIESVDVWGRRRLAYEIKKQAEGIYAVINLTAEPATVKELDRQLGLNDSVLRTKVLRPEIH